ncbi:MAG: winged helix DNA-binding protein [Asgard group archaeon]|nr:winged helix DNA-binding protein [Asgard group archaeon]
MLKKIKTFRPEALIADDHFRTYVESFESELLRGISTVVILQIIKRYPEDGIYGYQLLKTIEVETQNLLIVEEGTVYPLLRKMEKDGVLQSEKKEKDGRQRKYYILTDEGKKLLNHMAGFFSKLLEAMSPMMEFEVKLPEDRFMYCPNCANKIKLDDITKFCEVCGLYVEDLKN